MGWNPRPPPALSDAWQGARAPGLGRLWAAQQPGSQGPGDEGHSQGCGSQEGNQLLPALHCLQKWAKHTRFSMDCLGAEGPSPGRGQLLKVISNSHV